MSRQTGSLGADRSIASLTGSSQQAIAANESRQSLLISNSGNANVGVNLVGGTAAIGGTGTITLAAAGLLLLDEWVPTGAINVIGTAGQPLTIIEG